MTESNDAVLDKIWAGDLFDRKSEADLLQGYIESVSLREVLREDARAFTIAIDAPYGFGKSFFLRRFSEQLGQSHPVAYIDAWADDLADQPLIALSATLKTALEPILKKHSKVEEKWNRVAEKTGLVLKTVGAGVARRALGYVITQAGVDMVEDILQESSGTQDEEDTSKNAAKQILGGVVEDVAKSDKDLSSLIESRISEFEAGRKIVDSLKSSLSDLVASIAETELTPPIVIVIDELDRCRPSYAVKLLEEIKHLFDVPGLVFVLGINGEQLGHAVAGTYGANFDGAAYVKRFISRTYRLKVPDLSPLLEQLLSPIGITDSKISLPNIKIGNGPVNTPTLSDFIAELMHQYQLTARNAFELADRLQTAINISGEIRLIGNYLLPLLVSSIKYGLQAELTEPLEFNLTYRIHEYQHDGDDKYSSVWANAVSYQNAANLTYTEARQRISRNEVDTPLAEILNIRNFIREDHNSMADPKNYPQLLLAVDRFTHYDQQITSSNSK